MAVYFRYSNGVIIWAILTSEVFKIQALCNLASKDNILKPTDATYEIYLPRVSETTRAIFRKFPGKLGLFYVYILNVAKETVFTRKNLGLCISRKFSVAHVWLGLVHLKLSHHRQKYGRGSDFATRFQRPKSVGTRDRCEVCQSCIGAKHKLVDWETRPYCTSCS